MVTQWPSQRKEWGAIQKADKNHHSYQKATTNPVKENTTEEELNEMFVIEVNKGDASTPAWNSEPVLDMQKEFLKKQQQQQ